MSIPAWRDLLNEMGDFRLQDDGRLSMRILSGPTSGEYSVDHVNNHVRSNSIYFARMLLGEYQTLNKMSVWFNLKLKAAYLNRLSDGDISQLNGSVFSVIEVSEIRKLDNKFFNKISDVALSNLREIYDTSIAARFFLDQMRIISPSLGLSKVKPFTDAPVILKPEEVLTFALSAPTNDFTVGDIVVVGGSLSNFTGAGTSYTAKLNVTSTASSVTVSVARGKFSYLNVNNNAFNQVMAVDRLAPNAPTINVIATDDKINASEKAAGVVVSGTAESGSLVTINWGGVSQNIMASEGTWSTRFASTNIPVDNALSAISVKVTDAAGYVSTTTTRSVMIDTSAPTVVIDTNKASLLFGDTAVLTFTLSELSNNNFGVDDIAVVGGVLSEFTGSGMRYTAFFVGNAKSTQSATVSIKADSFTDEVGNKVNITASANKVMQVDTLLPIEINSVSLSADSGLSQTDLITNVPNQTVQGTLSRALLADEVVQISLDGITWQNATVEGLNFTLPLTLIEGTSFISVHVKDGVGEVGVVIRKSYTLNTSAPDALLRAWVPVAQGGISSTEAQETVNFIVDLSGINAEVGDRVYASFVKKDGSTQRIFLALTQNHLDNGFVSFKLDEILGNLLSKYSTVTI
jgi:predicted RNA binding protein with dsRBD fold (UPF0201 family)